MFNGFIQHSFPTFSTTKNVYIHHAVSLCISTGMLVMNLFIYYLVSQFGWRNMFRIMAGIILALGVPSVSTFCQPPKPPTHVDDDEEKKKPVDVIEVKLSPAAIAKAAEAEGLLPPTESDLKKSCTEVRLDVDQDVKVQIPGKPVSRSKKITQRLKVLTFPEVWFLALGLMGCAMTMSFYYVSMVRFHFCLVTFVNFCLKDIGIKSRHNIFNKLLLLLQHNSSFPDLFPFSFMNYPPF